MRNAKKPYVHLLSRVFIAILAFRIDLEHQNTLFRLFKAALGHFAAYQIAAPVIGSYQMADSLWSIFTHYF